MESLIKSASAGITRSFFPSEELLRLTGIFGCLAIARFYEIKWILLGDMRWRRDCYLLISGSSQEKSVFA